MSDKVSLENNNPQVENQQNILNKRNGIRGVIVAVVVVGVAFLIILVSKWNEIRQQRVPFVWRNRIKGLVNDSAEALHLAQEATAPGTSYKHALRAHSILSDVKKLVGTVNLSKLSGYDISKLESEIEALLRRNIPNTLLIQEDEDEHSKKSISKLKKESSNISKGPKRDIGRGNYETLRDVVERYKMELEDA